MLFAGTRRRIRYYRTGNPRAGSSEFPWFGLFFSVAGASTLASGIYRTATPNPGAAYARRLAEANLSEEAGLEYLRYRAEESRRKRNLRALSRIATGVAGAVYLALLPVDSPGARLDNILLGSGSALAGCGLGIYWFATPSFEQRLYRRARAASELSSVRPPSRRPRLTSTVDISVAGPASDSGDASERGPFSASVGLRLQW